MNARRITWKRATQHTWPLLFQKAQVLGNTEYWHKSMQTLIFGVYHLLKIHEAIPKQPMRRVHYFRNLIISSHAAACCSKHVLFCVKQCRHDATGLKAVRVQIALKHTNSYCFDFGKQSSSFAYFWWVYTVPKERRRSKPHFAFPINTLKSFGWTSPLLIMPRAI